MLTVRSNMGRPKFDRADIPMIGEPGQVIEDPIEVAGQTMQVTCANIGNPHAVIFVDDVRAVDLEKIGPLVERHPAFPKRTNVEFVEVQDRDNIAMRIWERGSGVTMASGSGSCGSALASMIDLRGARVVIIGAGGAARAAAFALGVEGAAITICNRTPSRAEDLARLTGGQAADIGILQSEGYDVVINATPVGMNTQEGAGSVTPLPTEWLRGQEIVFDFVYRPRVTPLHNAARDRGCRIISGLEMFLLQASEQYRLCLGADSGEPLDIMRQAAEKALQ